MTTATAVRPVKAAKNQDRAKSSVIPDANVREAATLLKHASDTTRLKMLLLLDARGSANVGEMCAATGIGQPALSHHAAILRHAGLIEPTRTGKNVNYALTERGAPLVRAARAIIEG